MASRAAGGRRLRWLPAGAWLRDYGRQTLISDLIAGIVVAIMLVPQAMAYAVLAGLPPQVGLYASILPLVIYGLLGSSRTLAVGPVAILSLLVATGISPLAQAGSATYIQLALLLALMSGVIQIGLGLLRLGALVNLLSHPVISGFTSAAAIVIGFSQLKDLLGYSVPRGEFVEKLIYTVQHLGETNGVTLLIGLAGIALLWFFKRHLARLLQRLGLPASVAVPLSKTGPLVVVALGALLVRFFALDVRAGVDIVGAVPAGLPPLTVPSLNLGWVPLLLPTALIISFVGYMESVSVAKSLAAKRRQKIEPNQELLALGAANVGAAFTGGFSVTGGFARSGVNHAAGAQTGMASIITAGLVALTLLFLTPLFYYAPQAMLAAIIFVAVASLIDLESVRQNWKYSKSDAFALLVTFVAVLLLGVEQGILLGALSAILLHLWRTTRPHIATVGRMAGSEIYRNVARHQVQSWPQVQLVRVDESLYFANVRYLEDKLLGIVADHPEVASLVLIGSGINWIDASALETLRHLSAELGEIGVALHFAELKGPVMDRLRQIGFVKELGASHFHLSAHDAMIALGIVPRADERDTLPAYAPVRSP